MQAGDLGFLTTTTVDFERKNTELFGRNELIIPFFRSFEGKNTCRAENASCFSPSFFDQILALPHPTCTERIGALGTCRLLTPRQDSVLSSSSAV